MADGAFAALEFLDAVVAILDLALGVQQSLLGEPDSIEYQVTAYSALGPFTVQDEFAGGGLLITVQVFAGLAYRLTGDPVTAERVVAAAMQDFIERFYADRTLGGIISNGQLQFDLNARPQYQLIEDQEFRVYLARVIGDQRTIIVSA